MKHTRAEAAKLAAAPRTKNKVTQLAKGLVHKLRPDGSSPKEKKQVVVSHLHKFFITEKLVYFR